MATQMSGDVQSLRDEQIFEPSILSEPHALLARMRAESPVCKITDTSGRDIYFVTDFALVQEASRRTGDFSSKFGHLLMSGTGDAEVAAILARDWIEPALMLVTDDPEHRRYRALVNAIFSMNRVAAMADRIGQIVDELIDNFIERGEVDFVEEFADLLPTYVIADMLGLPRDQYDLLRLWSDALVRIVSRMGTHDEEIDAAHRIIDFRRYILGAIAERRANPGDDVISNLIQARVEGMAPLTDGEIAPMTFEIGVAGNETTRSTLMSGIVRLLEHPDQLDAMRADPSLVGNAVEEMLRYETPASSMWRVTTADTVLGGIAIPAGATILLRYDAANRDPAKFIDPDRLDIGRENANQHCAFGGAGVHRCLGQMLARKELQIAFARLLERLEGLHLIADGSDTAYVPALLHHGITRVRLGFIPGKRLRH